MEYTASALVDLDLHAGAGESPVDVVAFERATLDRLGMPHGIVMRHRTPHFGHVFAGDGYSAAYYSYLWSEVLDADGFKAVEETGDIFDLATAKRLRDHVYAAGNRAKLVRYDRETGKQHEFQLQIASLLKHGDSRANVRLEPGDVIIIPESMC